MSALCCCIDGSPPARGDPDKQNAHMARYDKFYDHTNAFRLTMCDTISGGQPCCCIATIPCIFPCVQYEMRKKVLNHITPGSEMSGYICGQGYCGACCCFRPGEMGERDCPSFCMCLEAICCPGLAVSATRMLMMDQYALMPDECDNRIIRFNNCIQLLACVCTCLSILPPLRPLRHLVCVLDRFADAVFLMTSGCMTAQVDHEIAFRSNALLTDGDDKSIPTAYAEPVAVTAQNPIVRAE
jgi:hypothetical protein